MPQLENPGPVRRLTIVQRTIEQVNGVVNAPGTVIWGTNVKPFPEAPTEWFAHPTNWGGLDPVSVDATGSLGTGRVEADSVTEGIRQIVQYYSRIRSMRAVRKVTGGGGNAAAGPYTSTASNVDLIRTANTADGQQVTLINDYRDIQSGNIINRSNLNQFILNMSSTVAQQKNNILGQDGNDYYVEVCHVSCHNNCHNSRGRR
jgi:hypothetical protein